MEVIDQVHKCIHCGEDPGVKEGSVVWKGFLDQDTGEKCCTRCKPEHYRKKFKNPELRGLYSEVPLIVPPTKRANE